MRVIAKKTLVEFCRQHPDAEGALKAWHDEARESQWKSPHDIKHHYPKASLCANRRVVFNICGNRYRLIAEIQYEAGIVWIKFIGTHAEYDQIDAGTVSQH